MALKDYFRLSHNIVTSANLKLVQAKIGSIRNSGFLTHSTYVTFFKNNIRACAAAQLMPKTTDTACH